MFNNQHNNSLTAKQYRRVLRVVTKQNGSADRVEAAKAKRDRKNAKRARDARHGAEQ
jgi:hypothetical protein